MNAHLAGMEGDGTPAPLTGGDLLRLTIAMPPGWWDLPLEPATRERAIAELVSQRLPTAEPLQRAALSRLLVDASAAAHAAGAILASQFAVVDDGVALSASMTVAVREAAGVEAGGAGAGAASRFRRSVRHLVPAGDSAPPLLEVEYRFAVEGTPTEVVATFASPCTDCEPELLELFEAMVEGMEMRRMPA